MRLSLTAFCGVFFFFTPTVLRAQEIQNIANVEFRTDERVFAVMCALHVAGYDYALAAEPAEGARRKILAELNHRPVSPPLVTELREFYRRHNVEFNVADQQSKYISFALLLGSPPEFKLQLERSHAPERINALAGFETLLARFYREASIQTLWQKWQPHALDELRRMQTMIKDTIHTVLDYNRIPARLYLNRRIVIIPDLVDASNLINSVHLGGDYFLLASPETGSDRYRKIFIHEYLHYLLDPMLEGHLKKYGSNPALRQFLIDRTAYAEWIPAPERPVVESLINAVELTLLEASGLDTQALAAEMRRKDSPFLPYFKQQLAGYSAQPEPLAGFLDKVMKESSPEQLCASFETPPPPPPSAAGPAEAARPPAVPDEKGAALRQAERLIQAGQTKEAEPLLAQILAADPACPDALFGMGQALFARADYSGALGYFEKAVAAPGGPLWIRGWGLVRSGYCLLRLGRPAEAVPRLEQAAALAGDERGAAAAARRSLQRLADENHQ